MVWLRKKKNKKNIRKIKKIKKQCYMEMKWCHQEKIKKN